MIQKPVHRSRDLFLYDRDLRHERVKENTHCNIYKKVKAIKFFCNSRTWQNLQVVRNSSARGQFENICLTDFITK